MVDLLVRHRRLRPALVLLAGTIALLAGAPPAAGAPGNGLRFRVPAFETIEGDGFAVIEVERLGALSVGRSTIDYRTVSDGSAQPGVDYVEASGTLVFDVGQTTRSFRVLLRDDDKFEGREHLSLELTNPQGDAGSPGEPARLNIFDDDPEPPDARVDAVPASPANPPRAGASVASPNRAATIASPRQVAQAAANPRRRVAYRQSPVTPFELRSPGRGYGGADEPGSVEPLLAVIAGLFLARVGASAWFRWRLDSA